MQTDEINLLIICIEFPPFNSAGSYRPFYFAKYLSELNVNVTVLTVDLSSESQSNNQDLLKDLPSNVKIEWLSSSKCKYENVSKGWKGKLIHYFKTDDLWAFLLKREVNQKFKTIIEKYKINSGLITIPAFSIPRLFIPLLKKYNIPFVLDMRDHYSLWRPAPFTTYLHYIRIKRNELHYLESASKVLVVSKQMKTDLMTLHKSLPLDKIEIIPNGIEYPIQKTRYTTVPIGPHSKKFVIGYSGGFYFNPQAQSEIMKYWWQRKGLKKLYFVDRNRIEDWTYRSPYFFFRALKHLFEIAPELKSKIEFHYAGNQPEWLIEQLKEFNLLDNYKYRGYLNNQDIQDFHLSCDAYLMTSVKVIGGKDYCIASKTFSYLEGGRPILGFVTQGEQQDTLNSTGMSIIFDPDDYEDSARKLKNFLLEPHIFEFDNSVNENYLRINHSKELKRIIQSIYEN